MRVHKIITTCFIKFQLLLWIVLANLLFSQNTNAQIDLLLEDSHEYHRKYNDLKELTEAKKAAQLAEKAGDSKRKAESYYRIACALSSLELQTESFFFIQKASDEKYTKNSVLLQAQLKDIKSNNYLNLNLISQYKKETSKIISLLKNRKDMGSLRLLQRTYINIAENYCNEKKLDSTFYFQKLASETINNLPENITYKERANISVLKGNAFLQKKENDSAFFYFTQSIQLKQKYNDSIFVMEYIRLGDYYSAINNNNEALNYYLKAIQNVKDHNINKILFSDVYQRTADTYEKLGNKAKQTEYEGVYFKIQDQIRNERIKNTDFAINTILKDKQTEYKNSQQEKFLWIFGGIIFLIILFFIIYRVLHKNLKNKESLITEAETTLQQKDTIISQKSLEKEELQQKIGDAYKEVIELAHNNDPSFYFRFQEVYPEFQKKLLAYSPGLKTTELVLCAYIFLGFNVKDIAEYTFKSTNTIRNRKQNLRKKFNIPTEVDMEIWLKKLIYP